MNKLLADMDKKIVIPMGVINQAIAMNYDSSDEDYDEQEEEDQEYGQVDTYEQEYVKQEMARYTQEAPSTSQPSNMSEVEGVAGYDFKGNPLSVYASYNFDTHGRQELPIDAYQDVILNLVDQHPVVVIQGPTGCGKTTQVPQYILDHMRQKEEYCNIVVTQPRKIATITVAKRVCQERGWTLGTVCGYQIGLERKTSNDAILTYMTTGVLLQKLVRSKNLNQFTHIIIDEVHERNQDLDFLLLLVRRFLFTNSPNTKVVLMSATIDADEFSRYFRSMYKNASTPAPIVRVDRVSQYKRSFFYLEHLHDITDSIQGEIPSFDLDRPEIHEGLWEVLVELLSVIDKLDEVDPITNKTVLGSALVFLPGINEIEEANQRLTKQMARLRDDDQSAVRWEILPVHSSLPNDEQARVFRKARPGHRKIILSTNIAESSITVPDTCYVVDFCLTKVMTVDPITKYMSLKLEWAAHVNCDQRAGRVGRTGSGRVYRLVPRQFYEEQMMHRGLPEIKRAPLERLVLQSKLLDIDEPPRQILALAMNPPDLKNIENTILNLKEMGALLRTCRGELASFDGDLTFVGRVMANLPIDVRLSKLIVLGHMFSCLEEAIVIAAGCSVHNVFSVPFMQRFNAYKKMLMWADGSFSDLVALYNLYQVWQAYRRDNHFESIQAEHRWCATNFVNLRGLREWSLIVEETSKRLEALKIQTVPGQARLSADERSLILKIIAAGAFYPNYFVRTADGSEMSEREAVRAVAGRDPYRSVYFSGMELRQPVPIYTQAIKETLGYARDDPGVQVGFDNSSKVYVEFRSGARTDRSDQVTVTRNGRLVVTDAIPGKIPRDVYEVVRKRQLKYDFTLKILPLEEAWRFAEKQGIYQNGICSANSKSSSSAQSGSSSADEGPSCFSEETSSPLPTLDTEWITIKVTEFIDASHFWVTRIEDENRLARIEQILNKTVLREVQKTGQAVKVGNMYAARYDQDNMFYRCRVRALAQSMAQIVFVDYGNLEKIQAKNLYLLPDLPECKLPPLAVECMLHGVQPSRKMNPRGIWGEKANDFWRRQLMHILLYGRVHSVVDGVVYLELYRNKHLKSVNSHMLETGQADPAAESFLSRADHEKRLQVQSADDPGTESNRLRVDQITNYSDVEMPRFRGHHKTIHLKGPISPLEIKVFGCTESASNKQISVEGSSVNTVLLDNEPEDYHNRLLVAAYVSQSMNMHSLKLRQTTLMANIPGLPMLMCLLFCPWMEPKVTEDRTRVATILCGLGYSRTTKRATFPAHDLVLPLDTELTEEEVNRVNQIRYNMNCAVQLMADMEMGGATHKEMGENQMTLRKLLVDLIYAERKTVERKSVKFANVWGKSSDVLRLLKPQTENSDQDVWPLLWFVKLKSKPGLDPHVPEKLEKLEDMARNMVPLEPSRCPLCDKEMFSLYEVRWHVTSQEHKRLVEEYYEQLEDSD